MAKEIEYRIYNKIKKIKLPKVLEYIIGVILILLGVFSSLLPAVPGFVLVLAGVLFIIRGKDIKKFIKLRKWFTFMVKSFFQKHKFKTKNKSIIKQKIIDFKKIFKRKR